jgi:GxxExxY protein
MPTDILSLCDLVRQTAFDLHLYLGVGHLEKVYENGLCHRLAKQGIRFVQQQPLKVTDEDGAVLGDFFADIVVENRLLIELKAVRDLADVHVAQLLGYMKVTGMKDGLLINFGSSKFQVRKLAL